MKSRTHSAYKRLFCCEAGSRRMVRTVLPVSSNARLIRSPRILRRCLIARSKSPESTNKTPECFPKAASLCFIRGFRRANASSSGAGERTPLRLASVQRPVDNRMFCSCNHGGTMDPKFLPRLPLNAASYHCSSCVLQGYPVSLIAPCEAAISSRKLVRTPLSFQSSVGGNISRGQAFRIHTRGQCIAIIAKGEQPLRYTSYLKSLRPPRCQPPSIIHRPRSSLLLRYSHHQFHLGDQDAIISVRLSLEQHQQHG